VVAAVSPLRRRIFATKHPYTVGDWLAAIVCIAGAVFISFLAAKGF
jgi:hypothetical protein